MNDEIKNTVKNYILQEFLPGEDPVLLTDETPLITGGILDSIATLKLVIYAEEKFGIRFEAHEADKSHLDTIADIVHIISMKLS
jgi:acyl carrier protein